MEQLLFVLHSGKISQWNLLQGKLLPVTDRGRRAVPYSSETANRYWVDWKDNNPVEDGDVYDAIFLSECLDDFGELPKWICVNSTGKSAWTFEQLSLLSKESEFSKGLCLVQGKVKRLVGTDNVEDAIKLCLKSSLAFTLPKEDAKQNAPMSKETRKSATAGKIVNMDVRSEPSSNVFIGDSYNDPKALLLKVGDKVSCTVVSVRPLRGFCYLKSDKTSDLIRVKLAPFDKVLEARGSMFTAGMRLPVEVTAVNDKIVEFRIHQ